MKRLFGYLRRYGRRYLLGGACLLATATLAMTIPWLLKRAVEVIEQDRELSFLSVYVGLIIAFALVQGFARTLSRSLLLNIGRDVSSTTSGTISSGISSACRRATTRSSRRGI